MKAPKLCNKSLLTLAIASTIALSGCATINVSDRSQQAASDLQAMFQAQEPITHPISLDEAIARALKYNLDRRVKLMEEALAVGVKDVTKMSMLPKLTASAGYVTRNNDSGATSQSLLTGEQSLEPSTSQERDRSTSDLSLAWNLLDFGVSYASTQQAKNNIEVAKQRKRKTVQNIIQDVRYAYWRAVAAQELLEPLDALIHEVQNGLHQSDVLTAIRSKEGELRYQRSLLEQLNQLSKLREKLVLAYTELAALMNLRPGTAFSLAVKPQMALGPVSVDMAQLEDRALKQRPELLEEDYKLANSKLEARKAMLRLLPGVELNIGAHYDSNKYLFNNDWSDTGLRLSWNLLNLFSASAIRHHADQQLALDNVRRQALTLAVLTQVHLAVGRYNAARDSYQIAAQLGDVSEDLSSLYQAGGKGAARKNMLEIIREKAEAFSARMSRHIAYAEMQNALASIYASVGEDPVPEKVSGADITTLTQEIRRQLEARHL